MNADRIISEHLAKLGRKGGKARAKRLSKQQLHEIAMKGVRARKQKPATRATKKAGK